jgi:hypothetical protein
MLTKTVVVLASRVAFVDGGSKLMLGPGGARLVERARVQWRNADLLGRPLDYPYPFPLQVLQHQSY